MSLKRFASGHPIDKGTLSRYLNGKRVPRDSWFLDKLLTILAEHGNEVSPEVREHLNGLQLQALQTAHPHEYRVRQVNDELELAEFAQREADRYARGLEAHLADLTHRCNDLTDQLSRLRSAWDAERADLQAEKNDLEQEIFELRRRLEHARQRIAAAERHRHHLENLLENLDPPTSTPEFDLPARITPNDIREARFGTVRFRPGYDEEEVDVFLDKVEKEVELLRADREELAKENAELRAQLGSVLYPENLDGQA
ncbi:DivIVA domain-containing protein [Actinomadura rayongensis]|uniref:Cell wall synthesis protein Wag31 n=2 Tax=Actinomadura rayongensis TaxID=1429076 RepID=A0A6I4W684_9ACTN|nr:DivIVA domain-containing protein [Actinomadura rayongensis]